jgi:hypothetical protein
MLASELESKPTEDEMTDTTTAHQLYPASRTKDMATEVINKVIAFVTVDLNSTWVTYEGMTRDETVLTAQQSWCDLMDELHTRALAYADNRFVRGLSS